MAMFEQEIEMEKRQSSVVPLLLIVCLIISVVGIAGYYLIQSRKVVSKQEARSIIAASLREQGPATIQFRTGMVKASVEEKPHDPHYKLLEKAGIVRLGKDTGT
jgi:flagellar basal body-associated protein FliL